MGKASLGLHRMSQINCPTILNNLVSCPRLYRRKMLFYDQSMREMQVWDCLKQLSIVLHREFYAQNKPN